MIANAVQRLLAPDLPVWASLVPVRLLGRNVHAVMTRFDDEHERRRDCGLGAVDDRSLLRVLFDLPLGIAVPSAQLDGWGRGVLRRAPRGVVERDRRAVTRVACPAVRVDLVIVRARDWRCGIFDASQYGPFCRRVLALSAGPERRGEAEKLALEARLYGIGVVATSAADRGWMVPPAPFRPERFTSGQWLFHERAYAQVLDTSALGATC